MGHIPRHSKDDIGLCVKNPTNLLVKHQNDQQLHKYIDYNWGENGRNAQKQRRKANYGPKRGFFGKALLKIKQFFSFSCLSPYKAYPIYLTTKFMFCQLYFLLV